MIDPWALYESLALHDSSSLTTHERRLVAVGGLRTEVNNGGFHQYFYNSAGDLADEAPRGPRWQAARVSRTW